MVNPFVMKPRAVNLAERSIVQYPLTTESPQSRRKEGEWAKRNQSDQDQQHEGREFETGQARTVDQDVVTPRGSYGRRSSEGDGSECDRCKTQEPKSPVAIRMSRNELQVQPGKPEREKRP